MDKYDKAIAYLKENPHEIPDAWNHPDCRKGGCLFQYCSESGDPYHTDASVEFLPVGCLTQVKAGKKVAATEILTRAIRSDRRIPDDPKKVGVKHLGAFAAWQRYLDKVLRRKKRA
jgi:Tfp pilus assembly protein PilF